MLGCTCMRPACHRPTAAALPNATAYNAKEGRRAQVVMQHGYDDRRLTHKTSAHLPRGCPTNTQGVGLRAQVSACCLT